MAGLDVLSIVHDDQGLATLAPQNETTELIQNSEYQLQLPQDGEWTYGSWVLAYGSASCRNNRKP